jgi:hypothetical protein
MRPTCSTLIAVVSLLVAAPVAQACSIAINDVTPRSIEPGSIVRPISRDGSRAAWKVGPQWTSVRPGLLQLVRRGDRDSLVGVARRDQTSLRVLASLRLDQGYYLRDDADPATAACAIAGMRDWTDPKILVRETTRAVFVTAIARPTPGDRTGCVVDQQAVSSCEPLGFATLRLDAPVGDRRIVMQRFA